MASDGVVFAWGQSEEPYLIARDILIERGYLQQTRYGGGGKHSPSQFRFGPKALASLVGKSAHNIDLSPHPGRPAALVKKERKTERKIAK